MQQLMSVSPMDVMRNYTSLGPEDTCYLEIAASTTSNPEQLHRIFDLIPGLDYCNFDRYTGLCLGLLSASDQTGGHESIFAFSCHRKILRVLYRRTHKFPQKYSGAVITSSKYLLTL